MYLRGDNMKINEKLKQLRTNKKLSQNELAKILNVSLSSYQKYEREKNSVTPSLDVLNRISDYYNVTIDYLLGKETSENDVFNILSAQYNLTELEKDILKTYSTLPPNIRKEFNKYLKSMVKAAENESNEDIAPDDK